ncbi:MAG: TonB-dependent receptor, partial [Muribaculaceae bacterium]|nr:TonB-dependent receptor [Muribaculaceae bacterium]
YFTPFIFYVAFYFLFNNNFTFKYKGGEASLKSRYVGSQYMNNAGSAEAKLDSYFVTDLSVGYTFKKIKSVKELGVGITVYNIFNAKYFKNGYDVAGYYMEDGSPVIYRYAGYAAQAPINIMAMITVKF